MRAYCALLLPFLFCTYLRAQDAPQILLTVDRTDNALVSTCGAASNDCTLRGAITKINTAAAGAHSILFSGDLTIVLNGTGLPAITQDNVTIAAFSNQTVVVDGNNVAQYIYRIEGDDVTIFGQTLLRATIANISVTGTASNVSINGNLIGDLTEANDGCDVKNSNVGISAVGVVGFGHVFDNVIECINGAGIDALNSTNVRVGFDLDENAAGNQIRYNSTGVKSRNSNVLARDNDILFNLVDGVQVIEGDKMNQFFENTIHTNQAGDGIVVEPSAGMAPGSASPATIISRNTIWGNGDLAIDLNDDGFTPNDPGDSDTGPNTLVNYPEVSYVKGMVMGGTACGSCTVNVFLAFSQPAESGGGGSSYLGSVVADLVGAWTYDFTASGVTPGEATLTATSSVSGTSEFSPVGATESAATLFLEGPYAGGGTMSTALHADLPADQPFDGPPWSYPGPESVSSFPASAVDWLLIDLQSDSTEDSRIARQAVLLLDDGSVVDIGGASSPTFYGTIADSVNLVVRSRNHLAVLTPTKMEIVAGAVAHDFTISSGSAYSGGGAALKALGDGPFGLFAADANADGFVQALDFNEYITQTTNGATGYQPADFNLDGAVQALDFNLYIANTVAGASSQVP